MAYILDDRATYYNPYASDCGRCKHFDNDTFSCAGFPKGIPLSILKGDKKHREVWETQKDKITFTEK